MEARSKFFEKKLERSGVKIPRASILMSQGFNAPLLGTAVARTMSQGPNNLRTFSEIQGVTRDANLTMSAIGEEQEEEYKEDVLGIWMSEKLEKWVHQQLLTILNLKR